MFEMRFYWRDKSLKNLTLVSWLFSLVTGNRPGTERASAFHCQVHSANSWAYRLWSLSCSALWYSLKMWSICGSELHKLFWLWSCLFSLFCPDQAPVHHMFWWRLGMPRHGLVPSVSMPWYLSLGTQAMHHALDWRKTEEEGLGLSCTLWPVPCKLISQTSAKY